MYRLFYRTVWGVQIVASICLFLMSFWIEAQVLAVYLGDQRLALALAFGLEVTKVLTVVLVEIYHDRGDGARTLQGSSHRWSVTAAAATLRLGLLLLSAVATSMFLAKAFDRPRLDTVRSMDLTAEKTRFDERKAALLADHRRALRIAADQQRRTQDAQRASVVGNYQPQIAVLTAALNAEMGNTDASGHFEGRRFRSIERRLKALRQEYREALDALDRRQQAAVAGLLPALQARQNRQLQALVDQHDERLLSLSDRDYSADERVDLPQTRAFIRVVNRVSGLALDGLVLALVVSLSVAVLVELGIYVGFAYIGHYARDAFSAGERLSKRQTYNEAELESMSVDSAAARRRSKHVVDAILKEDGPQSVGESQPRPSAA